MARVTIEDCLKYIPNRFDMTIVASHRARQLSLGRATLLEGVEGQGKPIVVALREISEGKVGQEVFLNSR